MPIARLLGMAFRTLIDALHMRLREAGWVDVKPSYGFVLLAARQGSNTLNDVAAAMGMSKQAASKLVEGMRAAGYVRLAANPKDARSKHVVLTAHGEKLLAVVEDIYRTLEDQWADVVGRAQLDGLRADLEQVLRASHGGELPAMKPLW